MSRTLDNRKVKKKDRTKTMAVECSFDAMQYAYLNVNASLLNPEFFKSALYKEHDSRYVVN